MKSVDRVLSTLEHEEPDYVPLTDHIYMPKSLEGILGEECVRINTPGKYVRVHRLLGLDLICAFLDSGGTVQSKDSSMNVETDEWGVKNVIVDGMPWYTEGSIKRIEDFEDYVVPDPSLPMRFKSARGIVNLVKGDLAITGIIDGPFTRCWLLSGFNLFVRAVYSTPKSVQRLLDRIKDYIIEVGKGFIEIGVDIIWIADDLGMVNGPLLHPNTFRKIIFPYFKEIIHSFKKRKVKVLLHSDGQIMSLLDDLVKMGLDGIHPIERKVGMNLREMKEKYGSRIVETLGWRI